MTPPSNFYQNLFAPNGLLVQAEAMLRNSVNENPNHLPIRHRLAETLRQLGNLEAACAEYRKIIALDPQDVKAAYCATLCENDVQYAEVRTGELWPCPFIRLENFLSPSENKTVLQFALENEKHYESSEIDSHDNSSQINLKTRVSYVLGKSKLQQITSWFLPKLQSTVPQYANKLGVKSALAADDPEIQMTAHLSGGFFHAHSDNSNGRNKSRRISFLYYFHQDPKPYTGGDLLIFDSNIKHSQFDEKKFTRLSPINNSLVLFNSSYIHSVTPIVAKSATFEAGRFTLNGWFHHA